MDKLWEVLVNVEIMLLVKAPDAGGAETLSQDSLSHIYILDGQKDFVEMCDEWYMIKEIREEGER